MPSTLSSRPRARQVVELWEGEEEDMTGETTVSSDLTVQQNRSFMKKPREPGQRPGAPEPPPL